MPIFIIPLTIGKVFHHRETCSASYTEVEALSEVPIVDVGIAYDCPYTMECFILVFDNALSVPRIQIHC